VKRFLDSQGRGEAWVELVADDDAEYDEQDEINLSELEPLIALPSSPGNVVASKGRGRARDLPGDGRILRQSRTAGFRHRRANC
jgi:hypothetical protein